MSGGFIRLELLDLIIASSLLFVSAGASLSLRLGLERGLAIAAVRMVVQLTLLALVLKILFALVSPLWTGLAAAFMLLVAGWEVRARQKTRFDGFWTYGIATTTLFFAGSLVTLLALTTQLRPEPWFDPRYALPILGMILGNSLNGASLALDRLMGTVAREKAAIEAQLALGADIHQALGPLVRDAARAGMMTIINSMSASGVVFIPGLMTGQVLAGVPPAEAVKYQIIIMFLIAGANALGVTGMLVLARYRLTDSRHRLRLDRLKVARDRL
ncbi:MAG: ABC transporter permease [Magnetovibrionaceae bacterium]